MTYFRKHIPSIVDQMLLSLLIPTIVQLDRNVIIYLNKADPIKCYNPQSSWEQQTNSLGRSVHQVRTPGLSLCAFLNGIKLWTIINYSNRPNYNTCILPYKLMLRLKSVKYIRLQFLKVFGRNEHSFYKLYQHTTLISENETKEHPRMTKKTKLDWISVLTLRPRNTQSMTDAHIKVQKIFAMYFNICIFGKDIQTYHSVQEPQFCINYQDPTESFTKQQSFTQTDSKLTKP